MKKLDITGQKFTRLTAISYHGPSSQGAKWLCKCDCGKEVITLAKYLRSGNTNSCGCYHKSRAKECNTIHGHMSSKRGASPTYHSWMAMIARCTRPKNKDYYNYGALGISVCPGWKKFKNFLADMGERPENKTLDRINPYGNYEKENCRWADKETQANNKKRNFNPEDFVL